MITENLSTLKINKLTKAQYERELAAGRIDENALYLTPDEPEVAYLTYNVSTSEDADAAYSAGKVLIVIDKENKIHASLCQIAGTAPGQYYYFSCVDRLNNRYLYRLYRDTWTKYDTNLIKSESVYEITCGTEDLEAGVSELATGTLYFVYE